MQGPPSGNRGDHPMGGGTPASPPSRTSGKRSTPRAWPGTFGPASGAFSAEADTRDPPVPRYELWRCTTTRSSFFFGGYDSQQRLNDFWQFKLATEVTFIVDGKPVYAHKLLCMRGPYFKAMLEGPMREAQQKTITIPQVSHRVFLALLEHLYTDEVEINLEFTMDLFVASDQFGVKCLKRLCEQKILLSIKSTLTVWRPF